MDSTNFDRFTRLVSGGSSRRGFLKAMLAPAAAAIVAVPVFGPEAADARKKRRPNRNNNKDKEICLADGALCGAFANNRKASCCTRKTGRICAQALNASNSDTTCCGGAGAVCGGDNADYDDLKPYCCQGFVCSTDGLGTGQRGTCVRDMSEDEW